MDEQQIHQAVERAQKLAEEMGVEIVKRRSQYGEVQYELHTSTQAVFQFNWETHPNDQRDFDSVIEVLGFLEAISDIFEKRVHVDMPKIKRKKKRVKKARKSKTRGR